MTGKKAAKDTNPSTVVANDPDDLKGALKNIGGSRSDHWNNILAIPPSRRSTRFGPSTRIPRRGTNNTAQPSRR
jgi:hypothetical protein